MAIIDATNSATNAQAQKQSPAKKGEVRPTSSGIEKQVANLRTYYGSFDGTPNNFETLIRPRYEQLMHPDLTFVIDENKKELSYTEVLDVVVTFYGQGGMASIEDLKVVQEDPSAHGSNIFSVVILNTLPGETGERSHQTYHFDNQTDKLIRIVISPSNATEFSQLVDRVTWPDQERAFRTYFDAVNGAPDSLEKAMPLFHDLFSTEAVFEIGPGKELPFPELEQAVRTFIQSGAKASIDHLERNLEDGTIRAVIRNFVPGRSEEKGEPSEQTFHFSGTKIVRGRVSPRDAAEFDGMLGRAMDAGSSKQGDNLLDKYRAFLACFNGSPNSFDKVSPLLEEIFDPNLRIVVAGEEGQEDEIKDMAFFRDFCRTAMRDGHVAEILELERTGVSGLRTVIRDTVKGKEMGVSAQRGVIQNGKIVYWEAVEGNEKDFSAMVNRVVSN